MNISTLAKILGVSISELREIGTKNNLYGFFGRNTRIPYNSAAEVTKIIRPDKLAQLKNDDRIYLPKNITVADFSESINKPVSLVLKNLILSGILVTMNEKIDYDTAALIADELGVEVFPENQGEFDNSKNTTSDQLIKVVEYDMKEADKEFTLRPPVITVMGHVDHGKTTLLDTIRKTNVVSTEAGAITQHITSYQIEYKSNNPEVQKLNLTKGVNGGFKVTCVDTPGHEAFTAMRARGSQMADFVILVVSAVEGPKPQTVEVIERIKLGKVPVFVAINKIDLPDADIERVKNEVAAFGLVPEEWGGDVPFIPISAKQNQNIDKLLDTILVHAELAELKGQINCPGQAIVIESNMDTNFGAITTALVIKDKIKFGDIIRCDEYVGKIRKLEDTDGNNLEEAEIGKPVIIVGLPTTVEVGQAIISYDTVKQAQNDANLEKVKKAQNKRVISMNSATTSSDNQINLVIKADVQGSLEALKESIIKLTQDKVRIIIKSEGIGPVTENDLDFASTSNSTILVFHTDIPNKIEQKLKDNKINYGQSSIIYEIMEWIEEQILANTKYETKQIELGQAKVLAVFKSEKSSIQVFGGECTKGKIFSGKELKIIRGNQEIGKVEIVELQRNKVKAEEINISQQFGMSIKSKAKIQVNDIIVCYDEILIK
jgi:translation initiation factor IF-2